MTWARYVSRSTTAAASRPSGKIEAHDASSAFSVASAVTFLT
jgi:hypothetical protein